MARINKRLRDIANSKTTRKARNWFAKLPQEEQDDLLQVRELWHLGRPPLNGQEMSEVILQHFPTIEVKSKEVYHWLRKKSE